jgi:hypothetical protein
LEGHLPHDVDRDRAPIDVACFVRERKTPPTERRFRNQRKVSRPRAQ